MADNVIELNQHVTMTPEQTIEKASRYEFTNVLVIGRTEEKITLISSDTPDIAAYWMLMKCAQTVLDDS